MRWGARQTMALALPVAPLGVTPGSVPEAEGVLVAMSFGSLTGAETRTAGGKAARTASVAESILTQAAFGALTAAGAANRRPARTSVGPLAWSLPAGSACAAGTPSVCSGTATDAAPETAPRALPIVGITRAMLVRGASAAFAGTGGCAAQALKPAKVAVSMTRLTPARRRAVPGG